VTYDPDLYDVVTPASLQGDVDWYGRRAAESGGPVLELGAGTGRVTLAVAGAGVTIHALDASEEMLAALERKRQACAPDVRERIRLIHGDMRTFELPERFPLIIAPFRAFLHNVSEADQLACLARVRQHLEPGGQFLFNVFHPSLEIMARHTGPLEGVWRWASTFDRPDGGFVVRSEANHFDTVHQIVHSQHRYDEHDSAGLLTRTSLHRLELAYLYPPDLRRLLAMSGFTGVHIAGGFDGRDFSRDTDELVVEAVAGTMPSAASDGSSLE
jgi:ubiquinone/menaquinone biosynthesis C-methylase UbiE